MANNRKDSNKNSTDSKVLLKEIEDLMNENHTVKQKLAECIEELKNSSKEINYLKTELKKTKRNTIPNVEKLKKQKNELEEKKQKIDEENTKLKSENKALNASLKRYNDKKENLTTQIQQIKIANIKYEKEQKKLLEKNTILNNELKNLNLKKQKEEERRIQNKIYESSFQDRYKIKDEQTKQFNEQKEELENKMLMIRELEEKLYSTENELGDLQQTYQELKEKNRKNESEDRRYLLHETDAFYPKDEIANVLIEAQKMAKDILGKAKIEADYLKRQNESELESINKDIQTILMKASKAKEESEKLYERFLNNLDKIITGTD